MFTSEFIGELSGLLVMISAIPYAIQTYRRKVTPNVTSWGLWTLIGLSILLTYDGSGGEGSYWATVFTFTNPLIITSLAIWRGGERKKFTYTDKWCAAITITALGLWWVVSGNPGQVQFALYLGIIADAVAAIPTIKFVWSHPMEDRPFAWSLFGIGYGLSFFAVTEPSAVNYILPTYMFIGANLIAVPLIAQRLKQKTPLTQWV